MAKRKKKKYPKYEYDEIEEEFYYDEWGKR